MKLFDLVNDYITTIVDSYNIQRPELVWGIGKTVKGTYNLNVIANNGTPDVAREGYLVLHLEFIKYK